jgi:hypothetical protein
MENLNGHEAGNGGYSQGSPKAQRVLPLLGMLIMRHSKDFGRSLDRDREERKKG